MSTSDEPVSDDPTLRPAAGGDIRRDPSAVPGKSREARDTASVHPAGSRGDGPSPVKSVERDHQQAPQASASTSTRRLRRELIARSLSALALAGVALAATIAGVTSFAILICFIVSVLCWEWGRMVRDEDGGVTFLLHALFALLACVLAALDLTMLALVSLAIGAVIVGATRYGNLAGVSALGLFYIGVPAVALIWLRSDASHGLSAVLFVFMIVWTADTAAFVGGRLIGGAKLFPSISPNKTWSGFLTSLVAAAVVGAGFAFVLEHSPHVQLAMTGVILAIAAQIGDLCESALKRGYGVKDASGLIPGHGGFMDRLDGQIFASGVAAVLGVAMNWHAPAQGLLYW